MVITPGIKDLPYVTQVNGTKFFTLIAEEITWELVDGIFIQAWGYNGSTPGPTIRVYPGIIYVFVSLIDYLKKLVYIGTAYLSRTQWMVFLPLNRHLLSSQGIISIIILQLKTLPNIYVSFACECRCAR